MTEKLTLLWMDKIRSLQEAMVLDKDIVQALIIYGEREERRINRGLSNGEDVLQKLQSSDIYH